MAEVSDNYRFDLAGQPVQFVKQGEDFGIVSDGSCEPISQEEWEGLIEGQIEYESAAISGKIDRDRSSYNYDIEQKGDHPFRRISEWHGGVTKPTKRLAALWGDAEARLSEARNQIYNGDAAGAYRSLARARFSENHAAMVSARYYANMMKGYDGTQAFIDEQLSDVAIGGAIGMASVGLGIGAKVGLKLLRAAAPKALPAASKLFSSAGRGFARGFVRTFNRPVRWQRSLGIGAASGSARTVYDLTVAEENDAKTIAKNAAKAFAGGSFTGLAFSGAFAYHYVFLDVFGDFSKDHLTNIKKKYGDEDGTVLAYGLLAAENAAAIAIFAKMMTPREAAYRALFGTGVSIGLETYFQMRSGRELADIDPGRFVGSCIWGHSIVVLPEKILASAAEAAGAVQLFERTTELGLKYLLYVNPSVNNFVAKINDQDWENVMMRDTTRHLSVMWPARFAQALWRPASVLAIAADEGTAFLFIPPFNEFVPAYEGKPDMWYGGFKERLEKLDGESEQGSLTCDQSYTAITKYLSHEMGSLTLSGYRPSPTNLAIAKELIAGEEDEAIQEKYAQYMTYLAEMGEARSMQDEDAYAYLRDPQLFAHHSHDRLKRGARHSHPEKEADIVSSSSFFPPIGVGGMGRPL